MRSISELFLLVVLYLFSLSMLYIGMRLLFHRKFVEKEWEKIEGWIVGYNKETDNPRVMYNTFCLAVIAFTYNGKRYKITSQYNQVYPEDIASDGGTSVLINKGDPESSLHYIEERHYNAPRMFFLIGGFFFVTLTIMACICFVWC